MDISNITDRLLNVFRRCSLLDEDEKNIYIVEDISEGIDSFMYISVLVDIENEFNVEIPEEYLADNILKSIQALSSIINELST